MNTYMLRRMAYATFAVALGAAMLSHPASADTALTVGKASNDSDSIIPVDVGDKLGNFKKRGLDLKIVDFSGGGKLIQAMTADAIDIGIGAGIQMSFITKGVPMLAVCESTKTLPYFSFGVPWDSPIKTKAELKGKKVGVSTAGSLNDWLAYEFERSQGWEKGATQHVAIGKREGLSDDEIARIKTGADAGWSAADAALIRASASG